MAAIIEATGKTVEAAYENALKELGVSREQTEMEVITEPKSGFLGLFGGTDAKVRVTVKELSVIETAEAFLRNIFRLMNLPIDLTVTDDGEIATIHLIGDNLGVLIGKHGQTLDSLQYLTNLAANCGINENRRRIFIDIEDYRSRREETLRLLAKRLADKARKTGEKIMLEPMNCHERKIIHLTLQDNPKVKTYSFGEEPHRKVVIEPKNLGHGEYERSSYRGGHSGSGRGGYRPPKRTFEEAFGYEQAEPVEGSTYEAPQTEQTGEQSEERGFRGGRGGRGGFRGGRGGRGGFRGDRGGRGGFRGGRGGGRFEKSPYTDPNYEPDFSMFNESVIRAQKEAEAAQASEQPQE